MAAEREQKDAAEKERAQVGVLQKELRAAKSEAAELRKVLEQKAGEG